MEIYVDEMVLGIGGWQITYLDELQMHTNGYLIKVLFVRIIPPKKLFLGIYKVILLDW
jgi:hypothetical protein